MSIVAAATSQVEQRRDVVVTLPENLEPLWRKLNNPMPPVSLREN